MSRKGSGYSVMIDAAVFILLEIAAVAMLRSSSSLQDIWINRASRRCQAMLWGSGEALRRHFSLQQENDALHARNFALEEELRRCRQMMEEVQALPQTTTVEVYRYTPAKVVKMSRNSAHNYIILNKGSEDGIKPHSGIISDKGVVGVIEAVDRHFSYGLTLNNNRMAVGARIKGTDVTGPLVWNGKTSNGAHIKDIALHHEITPGDTVVTSGFSSIFPPDIPVGLTGEMEVANGFAQQVNVELFQDFRTLHYVTVVENTLRHEIEQLEGRDKEEKKK